MSLNGKTILITRRREQSGEMIAEIEQRGGRPVVIPMISVSEPDSWEQCDKAFESITQYDAILFVSANAVAGCVERFELRCQRPFANTNLEVFAVGERTKVQLEARGMRVSFVPEEFSARSLVEHLKTQNLAGKRVLLPRGNLGNEELPRDLQTLGALVTTIEVYKTSPADTLTSEALRQRVVNEEFDVVTFASPSAVRNFACAVPVESFQSTTRVAVIGPTTRNAVLESGYAVDIEAEESTSRALVESIDRYFHEHKI